MSNRSAAASGVPTVERGAADPRIVILMLCAAVALAIGRTEHQQWRV